MQNSTSLKKETEIHIDELYDYGMYKSDVYWRNCNDVENGMSSLKSLSSQKHEIRENIKINVMGFGWTEFSHAWSKNGVDYTTSELALQFKNYQR